MDYLSRQNIRSNAGYKATNHEKEHLSKQSVDIIYLCNANVGKVNAKMNRSKFWIKTMKNNDI